MKWRITRDAPGAAKYIICNADEGDPGAYMNRNEMESDPHMLIEGMIIGAYAIGAKEGLIYIRADTRLPSGGLCTPSVRPGPWGSSGKISSGPDLISISGSRPAPVHSCAANPRPLSHRSRGGPAADPRPPRLTDPGGGLWGIPSDLNNVETWCNIPVIIRNGSGWYAKIGAEKNAGTKVFSLVGKVDRVGLVEVPLGTSLNTIVCDIGNGGAQGKKVKAVQTGRTFRRLYPGSLFDTPVNYESLNAVGSIMGSGGIVVMDEDTDMVDIARYFINFATGESAGNASRAGKDSGHTLILVNRLIARKGTAKDLETLALLADTIKNTSLCGLGQSAPNPVLTTLAYFREEYDALVKP